MRYLVLCGGGSRGAIEVGFAEALWEHGLRFDAIMGSSVGALNGAFLAAGRHPRELAEIWKRLRFRDVFRFNWRLLAAGLRSRAVFRLGPAIASLLRDVGFRRIEELPTPFVAVATDLATGAAVEIDHGPLADAVRASFAIPGLLPPVKYNGRWLVDGSLAADLPLAQAAARGADEIWAVRCACCANPRYRFDSLGAILMQTFGIAVDRGRAACEQLPPHVAPRVWSVDAGLHVTSLDFSASPDLIAAAYRQTSARLAREQFTKPR